MSKFGSQSYYGSAFRQFIWRLGRKIYCWVRNDLTRGPESNGEYELLRYFLQHTPKGGILIDIGAHRGEWSRQALNVSKAANRGGVYIHAFEPSSDSFRRLQGLFHSEPIILNNFAVSNMSGRAQLFVRGAFCGVNSVYEQNGGIPEEIEAIHLDEYAVQQNLDHIDFVKCDTEGHDFYVMQGASRLLTSGKIAIWQFEYNHRWIDARCYLKDVFDFIRGKSYWIGKLSARGVEIYEDWHPELERYFETNFVLIHRNCTTILEIAAVSKFGPSNVPIPVSAEGDRGCD